MPELGFFILIYDFLSDEIAIRMSELLGRATTFATSVALILMTIWVWWQGWRLVTGQSRDSMAQFFAQSAQRVFIIAMAFGMSIGGTPLYEFLAEGLPEAINEFVTGDNAPLGSSIDDNLLKMQLAMSSIDLLQTGGSEVVADAKARAQWFAGIGTGGPAIVGGTMLLLFKIAIGLFVGFGPIFILCLLFDFTKQLFSKWLFYGIGTMFALAMLSMMVEIATRMVSAVAVSMWLGDFVTNLLVGDTAGINSRAMQQGGLGLILTMMIISVPPIAAAFFNGVLGQFSGYNAFGQGAVPAGVRGPGTPPSVQHAIQDRTAQSAASDAVPGRGTTVDPRSFGVGTQATGVPNERVPIQGAGERGVAVSSAAKESLRAPMPPRQAAPTIAPQDPTRG
jgi:type IV secretion system protein VirB6